MILLSVRPIRLVSHSTLPALMADKAEAGWSWNPMIDALELRTESEKKTLHKIIIIITGHMMITSSYKVNSAVERR